MLVPRKEALFYSDLAKASAGSNWPRTTISRVTPKNASRLAAATEIKEDQVGKTRLREESALACIKLRHLVRVTPIAIVFARNLNHAHHTVLLCVSVNVSVD